MLTGYVIRGENRHDDRSAADAFLRDQEFIEAPLSTDVMPIGVQDAALLLFETVGPRT